MPAHEAPQSPRDSLRRAIVVGEFAVLPRAAVRFASDVQEPSQSSRGRDRRRDRQRRPPCRRIFHSPRTRRPKRRLVSFEPSWRRRTPSPASLTWRCRRTCPSKEWDAGEGLFIPGNDEGINVRFKRIDASYLDVLGIPVLAGRGFAASDRDGAPRALVVNVELARRLADELGRALPEIVGQNVHVTTPFYVKRGGESVEGTIVGVIRSERVGDIGDPHHPVVYVPLAQVPTRSIRLLVRSSADPSSLIPAIQDAVRAIDPNLPLGDVRTMEQVKQLNLAGTSQPTWVVGAFAALAAFLAALGMYGVLSHAVAQQRREIGIRVAFGASRSDILSHILRSGASMVVAGLVLGLLIVAPTTAVLDSVLFEVSTLDPVVIVLACVSMVLIGGLAGFVPASRAASVDPMSVLRNED